MLTEILPSLIKLNKPASIESLETSVCRARVWPHLIDYNLHLNNANYLTCLERGRWKLFRDIAWFKPLLQNRINLVIASLEITFIRELRLLTGFNIESRILSWDEKYIYVEQRVLVKGKLHSHALVKLAGVSKGRRVLSETICEALDVDYKTAPSYDMVEHWSAMTQAKRDQ